MAFPKKQACAYFIRKQRPRIVTRPDNRNGRQRRWRSQMFRSLPALRARRPLVRAV